jgi:hypothetical protein
LYNENEGSSLPSVIEPGVVEPGARKIISYYRMADKSEADAVRQGGGTASFLVTPTWDLADAVERTFAIDLIVFADGAISGPDPTITPSNCYLGNELPNSSQSRCAWPSPRIVM